MAKVSFLLALAQASFIYGAPVVEKRAVAFETSIPVTTSYSSPAISEIQTATPTVTPTVTGTVNTALPTGFNTQGPINSTSIDDPDGFLPAAKTSLKPQSLMSAAGVDNVFVPMATDAPPSQITKRDDHPVKPLGLKTDDKPAETNKFYANLFLGSQTQSVWTHPYSLSWLKGNGDSWGIAVSHIERAQLAWADGNPPQYFIGPIGLHHVVFSAAELGQSTVLTTESSTAFSVTANLHASAGADPLVSFPLVQGMGMVTALYSGATPVLNSSIFFRTLQYVGQVNGVTYKYQIVLEDGSNWVLYATPTGSLGAPPFDLKDSKTIVGPAGFTGSIQVAKNPAAADGEKTYDAAAGAYATTASITGTVNDATGSYTLAWNKEGVKNQTLVMFALPHHQESFDDATKGALTSIELVTTTKGTAKAVLADKITMVESDLPIHIGFGPAAASIGGATGGTDNTQFNQAAIAAINTAGASELNEDMISQTSLDSMYYSGKGLAKFAQILFTVNDITKNSQLAAAGLAKLKTAFDVFVQNKQPLPLVYDTVWKGAVSSGTYKNGDSGIDFGNSYYNDHHFHYGYFVWAAAVIGYLDPSWLEQGDNKAWVNMLVRDYANPSDQDPYFPFTRSFDWFHGHSWAKGLFESGDGKDEESSSEDTFATYALKMWGKVTGDAAMEARGNLQLAVQARSLRNYFLLSSDNKVQPEKFIANKVTGIMFENKVDHTTYFGNKPEHIQGIHMIPLNPSSTYTRPAKFVQEEWDAYFSNGRADQAEGGWRGILYANLALVDPVQAWNFFSSPNFDMGHLDGGASLTWYLAWTAGLGGAGNAPAAKASVKVADKGEVSDVEGRSSDDEGYWSSVDGEWVAEWVEDEAPPAVPSSEKRGEAVPSAEKKYYEAIVKAHEAEASNVERRGDDKGPAAEKKYYEALAAFYEKAKDGKSKRAVKAVPGTDDLEYYKKQAAHYVKQHVQRSDEPAGANLYYEGMERFYKTHKHSNDKRSKTTVPGTDDLEYYKKQAAHYVKQHVQRSEQPAAEKAYYEALARFYKTHKDMHINSKRSEPSVPSTANTKFYKEQAKKYVKQHVERGEVKGVEAEKKYYAALAEAKAKEHVSKRSTAQVSDDEKKGVEAEQKYYAALASAKAQDISSHSKRATEVKGVDAEKKYYAALASAKAHDISSNTKRATEVKGVDAEKKYYAALAEAKAKEAGKKDVVSKRAVQSVPSSKDTQYYKNRGAWYMKQHVGR